MSNLAISGNGINRQEGESTISGNAINRQEVIADLRAKIGIAAAAVLQYRQAGVETPEREEAGRRYCTLLGELVKEEQLEYSEYLTEMHRLGRLPRVREQMHYHRRRLGI